MFLLAKFFLFLTQPLAWVALLVLLGLLLTPRRPRWAVRANAMALALLLLLGWEPLPDAALRYLEAQYPAAKPDQNWSIYAGVIVLGGALEPAYVWTVPGQSALNDAAERMTEVMPLLRRQPHLTVLFTGGEGQLFASGPSEAERARTFFQGQGLQNDKLLLESASRTTYENAVLSKQLPGVDAAKPWLLMTSAFHMPRHSGISESGLERYSLPGGLSQRFDHTVDTILDGSRGQEMARGAARNAGTAGLPVSRSRLRTCCMVQASSASLCA